jgi:hypothetical protein
MTDANLTCHACGASWAFSAPPGLTLAQWTALHEAQACPGCGAAYRLTSQWSVERWEEAWRPRHAGRE